MGIGFISLLYGFHITHSYSPITGGVIDFYHCACEGQGDIHLDLAIRLSYCSIQAVVTNTVRREAAMALPLVMIKPRFKMRMEMDLNKN
mmetsp:Transcript_10110/g.14708  ORF Transcript_10110/g.14708 Transcript_10110/m.14708 type:complete len:89 (+) Transcript_10110:211-477(+)